MKKFIIIFLIYISSVNQGLFAQEPPPSEYNDIETDSYSDEFDFGSSKVNDKKTFSLPIQGKFKYEAARQVNGDNRWIKNGPSLYLIYDNTKTFGQLYFEGNTGYNRAYRLENDSDKTINDNEFYYSIREAYYKIPIGNFTFSIGNVINSWTVADILSVSDKMVIYDQSENFFADVEDITSGQNTVRIDFFSEYIKFCLIYVPYPLYDKIEDGDHPYSITPGIELEGPDNRKMEYAGYINLMFEKFQIKLIKGYVNNRLPVIGTKIDGTNIKLQKEYNTYFFTGYILEYAYAPFLLKNEVVYNNNIALQKTEKNISSGQIESDRIDIMTGIDINIGNWGTIINEHSMQILTKKNDKLATNRNIYNCAISWSNSYFSDTLDLIASLILLESIENRITRISMEYALLDNLSFKCQYTNILINKKEQTYNNIEDYDRIDLSMKYGFSLN